MGKAGQRRNTELPVEAPMLYLPARVYGLRSAVNRVAVCRSAGAGDSAFVLFSLPASMRLFFRTIKRLYRW